MERLARNKDLLWKSVNYGCNMFYDTRPWREKLAIAVSLPWLLGAT
jgi:hypothetical protein